MSESQIAEALEIWPRIGPALHVPHTDAEYRQLVALLDRLIDEVGETENHPLASLMEILGVLIERYEDEHVPELTAE
jgi:HTH-type transcriptional regulator / antitoxin HigA